jgi:hypothetical protein
VAFAAFVGPPSPPKAAFSFSPSQPATDEKVTFKSKSSDPNKDIAKESWDLDGDGRFGDATGSTADTVFHNEGRYDIGLRVTDLAGHVDTATRTVEVSASSGGGSVSFSFSPSDPVVGQTVTFESDTSDQDVEEQSWDLNGDGQFGDATGSRTQTTFSSPGRHKVRLRITDLDNRSDTATQTVDVVAGPVAGFTYTPATPVVGETMSFSSTATAPEGGSIESWSWDLDGDGRFDDADGANATWSFDRPGNHAVGLRVEDGDGHESTISQDVAVYTPSTLPRPPAPPPAPPPPPPPPAKPVTRAPQLMSPFPVVRIRGQVLARGALVDLLSVSAPRGALVRVSCRGRGCPMRLARAHVGRRSVRFRSFQRLLPAGVVLEIRVTKGRLIGKYTRFVIRRRAAPARRDLCVGPVSHRPVRCPAG